MAGNIITTPGHAPEILSELKLKFQLMEFVVGSEEITKVQPLAKGETLMLNVGTAKTAGVISEIKGKETSIKLNREVAAREQSKVAISRRVSGRFRLIGVGEVLKQ